MEWGTLFEGWASGVQFELGYRALPECLTTLIAPPLTEVAPAIHPVAKTSPDPAIASCPVEIPAISLDLRSVPTNIRKKIGPGFLLASIAHLIVFAYFLAFPGSAGSLRPASIDAIDIELVTEQPGEAAAEEAQQQAITPPIEEETVQQPQEAEALIEAQKEAPQSLAADDPPDAPEPEPLEHIEQASPQEAPPAVVKPIALPKPEPVRRQSTKASKQGRDAVAGENSALIDAYKVAVASKIARNKPAATTAASAQGVVLISFTIAPNGNVVGIRISQSSGHSVLDQAALATINHASPFPPPPSGAPRLFTVPIRFNAK